MSCSCTCGSCGAENACIVDLMPAGALVPVHACMCATCLTAFETDADINALREPRADAFGVAIGSALRSCAGWADDNKFATVMTTMRSAISHLYAKDEAMAAAIRTWLAAHCPP